MNSMNDYKYTVNGRIWIEGPEGKLLGPGRTELLERIHTSGSIRQAAMQMKMSYKQAWDIVNHLNINFDEPLVISHRGGKGGGKAEVTAYGLKIIDTYHELQKLFQSFLSGRPGIINL